MRILMAAAAASGLALVVLGAAFGHASAFDLDVKATQEAFRAGMAQHTAWDSAMVFGFAHVLAALAACALPLGRMRLWAGWAFLTGVAFFSFGLAAKAALHMSTGSEQYDGLGKAAPVGGIAFMIGWVLLLVAALRPKAS